MVVNRPLLWVLMGLCCLPSAATLVRRQLREDYYRRHDRWHEAPAAFVGACVDAALTGVAVGLSVAFAVLVLASLRAQLV